MSRRLLLVATLALSAPLVQCIHADANVSTAPTSKDCSASLLTQETVTNSLTNGSYVLISAGRNTVTPSIDAPLSDADIKKRNEALKEDLCKLKLPFSVAEGHYDQSSESSFFVLASRPEQQFALLLLGAQYHQDSVIVGNHQYQALVYTTGAEAGKAQIGKGWGRSNGTENGYTAITLADGKRLMFCLNFNFNADKTVTAVGYLDWMQTSNPSPAMQSALEGQEPCNMPMAAQQ